MDPWLSRDQPCPSFPITGVQVGWSAAAQAGGHGSGLRPSVQVLYHNQAAQPPFHAGAPDPHRHHQFHRDAQGAGGPAGTPVAARGPRRFSTFQCDSPYLKELDPKNSPQRFISRISVQTDRLPRSTCRRHPKKRHAGAWGWLVLTRFCFPG